MDLHPRICFPPNSGDDRFLQQAFCLSCLYRIDGVKVEIIRVKASQATKIKGKENGRSSKTF